uniref:Thrombomodulin-like n=1 Tax=Erpetoichthys calabaricus TaxID=27687 RepID=A0A8C4SZ56_ERPCA
KGTLRTANDDQWPEVVLCSRNTCYMIHQGAADFHTANTTCSHRGGHLMTVQSTVHSDIISILMENLQGRFWIGLELPAGCCGDPSKALRGYQWVTGEEATDFSQWRTQDSSECGHQCVSISKDQLWEESSCLEVADGFLCEYNFNETCRAPEMEGFSLTCHTLLGFQMMDTAQLPPGTIAIMSPTGYKLYCDTNGWKTSPCDSQHENDGCSHICEMEGSEAKCMCPEGLQLEGSQVTCETPDPCRNHPCEHLCVSRLQSYTCLCREGYLLDEDGLGCRDQDECLVQSICTPGQVCVNTPGSFRCTCPPGYVMVNGECEDPSVTNCFCSERFEENGFIIETERESMSSYQPSAGYGLTTPMEVSQAAVVMMATASAPKAFPVHHLIMKMVMDYFLLPHIQVLEMSWPLRRCLCQRAPCWKCCVVRFLGLVPLVKKMTKRWGWKTSHFSRMGTNHCIGCWE